MSFFVNIGRCCDILDQVHECIFHQHEMKPFIHSFIQEFLFAVVAMKGLKIQFVKEPPNCFKHGTPWEPIGIRSSWFLDLGTALSFLFYMLQALQAWVTNWCWLIWIKSHQFLFWNLVFFWKVTRCQAFIQALLSTVVFCFLTVFTKIYFRHTFWL